MNDNHNPAHPEKPVRIRTFFPMVTGALCVLLLFVCFLAYVLFEASQEFLELHERHVAVERTADELRQSSDDLTRYSRLYAVTGDAKYLAIYNSIIDIRNGREPRPQNYEHIYWDLKPDVREERHPPGETRALRDVFPGLMTAEEIGTIEESRAQSDLLALSIERDAFDAIARGGASGREEAIRLLHSEEYRDHKHKIMLPLDQLAAQIRDRLQRETDDFVFRVRFKFILFAASLLLGVFILVSIMRYSRDRILKPINLLTQTILENRETPDAVDLGFRNDEIGLLAHRFFQMKSSMEHNYRELETASFRDALTEVYNRNYFFQEGEVARKRALRGGQKLCVMMADLDHFKSINDTHGHLVGDDALKHAANIIADNVRETDIVARFGGEEFVVILIKASLDDAASVAEKIRSQMEATPCESHGETIKVTISIGTAEVLKDDENLNAVIAVADRALYAAKENGRNRVEVGAREEPATENN